MPERIVKAGPLLQASATFFHRFALVASKEIAGDADDDSGDHADDSRAPKAQFKAREQSCGKRQHGENAAGEIGSAV